MRLNHRQTQDAEGPRRSAGNRCNPYLFVVGCPRSGTTLLQRMLNSHPMLAVSNDTHFIPRVIGGTPRGVDPPVTEELVEAVVSYHRFHRLGVSTDSVKEIALYTRRYSELVRGLYDEVARLHNKPLAGEKTPDYCRHIPLLHALFPSAKFVHIIRDGRNVALSALDWANPTKGPGRHPLWKEEPFAVCALWWRFQVSAGRTEGRQLDDELYCEVSYESLVESPDRELTRISSFLGLPYSKKMGEYYHGKVVDNPKLSAKGAWLPPTQGLRDWRVQMQRRELEIFEAIAGPMLLELNYEPGVEKIPPNTARLASRCEERWSCKEQQTERKPGRSLIRRVSQ